MHRSRLSLLVIAVVVPACSKRGDSADTKTLSQDPALAARVDSSQKTDQRVDRLPLPDTCGTVAIPDQPAADDMAEAADLAHQAYEAEVLGNIREASALLRRASTLDWIDKSSAYHLGRVNEALGHRTDAIKAYCRFMALAPTMAEQAEASQRVASLSRSQTQLAVATPRRAAVATARRVTHRIATIEPRLVAGARVGESFPAALPKRGSKQSTSMAAGAVDLPMPNEPATAPRAIMDRADSVAARSDGGAIRPAPNVDQPNTASPTERRGPSKAQGAGIGAVAGAIIGGVAGRSVKAAAIGAATGGILGAAAARGTRSPIRGIAGK